jgi:hypothetical protein
MAQNLDSQLRGEFGEEGKGFRRLFNVACAELRESCQLFREKGHCSWWEIDHVQLGALRNISESVLLSALFSLFLLPTELFCWFY